MEKVSADIARDLTNGYFKKRYEDIIQDIFDGIINNAKCGARSYRWKNGRGNRMISYDGCNGITVYLKEQCGFKVLYDNIENTINIRW